jgi:hypothetical protein
MSTRTVRRLIFAICLVTLLTALSQRGFSPSLAQSATSGAEISQKRLVVSELTRSFCDLISRYQHAGQAERNAVLLELRNVAAARHKQLAELIQEDPAGVLAAILPESLRSGVPTKLTSYVERNVELEGELEVFYEDSKAGSHLRYFLRTRDERLSLHFAADAPTLLTGSKVRVKGVRVDQSLALASGGTGTDNSSSTGMQTLSASLANTLGQHKVLVILVNFQDEATQPFTVADASNVTFGTTTIVKRRMDKPG